MPNLVGTGLNQVPTNSMLGGLAYQDPEHASIKDLDLKNLSQINSEIDDTAVDVFVYDTRKDSDGGAWRKRTQNTSWYNETLGTVVRGTRKEFPAIAVIVAESTKVTIYDGDDPDLPMWMVFYQNTNYIIYSPVSCVSMLNGKLVVGVNPNTTNNFWDGGIKVFDFISEYIRGYSWSSSPAPYYLNISERNYTSAPQRARYVNYKGILNNPNCNDVAMTVLPNAPIDDATGLPIPTIAVATDSGVSVIKDDGSVFDYTYQENVNNKVPFVDIDSSGRIYWASRKSGSVGVYFHEADLPVSDSSSEPPVNLSVWQAGAANAKRNLTAGTITDVVRTKDKTVLGIDGTDSKAHLNLYNTTGNVNSGGSLGNFQIVDISKDYNTGYMHGDIKCAFLSDTDTTSVTGSEKIPNPGNGNFTATTDWVAQSSGGTLSISGGNLKVNCNGNYHGCQVNTSNLPTLVEGKQYIMTVDVAAVSAGSIRFGVVSGMTYSGSIGGDGIHHTVFTAGASVTQIFIDTGTYGSSMYFELNSVNLREAELDRSINGGVGNNNKGLAVFGTITKTPVVTGADLVGYSGNGSSNYLEQPHNSDLDFGANSEFSVMGWMYNTNVGGGQLIFDRSVTHNSSRDLQVWVAADLKYLTMYLDGGQAVVTPNNSFPNNAWFQFVVVRTGGYAKIYINGVEKASNASTSSTIPASKVPMKVLYNCNSNTKLALLRISGSVPSPEQIKKMYEDEKHLFQENAKATLYGSSDAVTALAYDDTTNLLHVGTSAGLSEFQGLRRINNTTEAVTTAISASNGFVAEQ